MRMLQLNTDIAMLECLSFLVLVHHHAELGRCGIARSAWSRVLLGQFRHYYTPVRKLTFLFILYFCYNGKTYYYTPVRKLNGVDLINYDVDLITFNI